MHLVLPLLLNSFSHLLQWLLAKTAFATASFYAHHLMNDHLDNYSYSFPPYYFTSNPRASLNFRTSSTKLCPFSMIVASFNTGSFSPSNSLSTYFAYPLLCTLVTLWVNIDPKSTRLNCSHVSTSFAVFC